MVLLPVTFVRINYVTVACLIEVVLELVRSSYLGLNVSTE
jgi:hypothetical protein